jgi:hypothetical protein
MALRLGGEGRRAAGTDCAGRLVIDLFVPNVELPFGVWLIAGGAGAISILFVLYKLVSKPGGNVSVDVPGVHASVGTAYGIWVALLAAIAVVVGAWLSMTESQR